MRLSSKELDEELLSLIRNIKARFEQSSKKGCSSRLFTKPVHLEPYLTEEFPGSYNRETKDVVILKLYSSQMDEMTPEKAELFLESLRGLKEPISFEVIGSRSRITIQITCQKKDRRIVSNAFERICDYSYLKEASDVLVSHYKKLVSEKRKGKGNSIEFQFNDFYFPPPYYFPINTPRKDFGGDILNALFSSISRLETEELGFYQILFIPAKRTDWAKLSQTLLDVKLQREEMSITDTWSSEHKSMIAVPQKVPVGEKFHPVLDEHDLKTHTAKAWEKIKDKKPFFAVSIRTGLFVKKGKAINILDEMRGVFYTLLPGDGSFSFLNRDHYFKEDVPEILQYYMFFNRVPMREGMLLTSKELSGLVHFPTKDTLKKDYPIETAKGRRPAPDFLFKKDETGIVIGDNLFKGKTKRTILSHELRAHHCHIVGGIGYGKSTFIGNCVIQDIEQGTGVCVIDPHGDLQESIIPRISVDMIDRVIYFDPIKTPLPINILEARDERERIVLADDVVSIFKQFSESWGIQIGEILSYGVLAILSSKKGGHLGTLHKFLIDAKFRREYLESVEDDFVVDFWQEQFPHFLNIKGAITTAVRRLNQFLRSTVLKEIVSHKESAFNFREVMDQGKVLLVNLPLGEIGSVNAYILGSLIISRIQVAALSRQDIPKEERKPFYLYIDEFQNFMCTSVEECLTGTRKYALGLVLAHHSLGQLRTRDRAVADAVLEIPHTRICFGVGDEDSVILARGFSHYMADDLKDLKKGEAIVRVDGASNDFEITTHYETPPPKEVIARKKEALIRHTLEEFNIQASDYSEKDRKLEEHVPEPPQEKKKEHISYAKTEQVKALKRNLMPEEIWFLEFLEGLQSLLPVRDVYTELRLNTYQGNKMKKILLELEVISETEMDLGKAKRKSKVLALTPTGYKALGLPLLSGRGGSLHQFLQKIIARHAEMKGYEAIIEEGIADGKRVDIGLHRDGEKIAVEISVTIRLKDIVSDIEFAFRRGGYDRIIALFSTFEALSETKKHIVELLPEETRQKIILRLASEYEELL